MITRIIIFSTHPIQYQAPWFKLIAADPRFELQVVFSYVPDSQSQGIGFGTSFAWDTPLREGYNSQVLGKLRWARDGSRFFSGWATGIFAALRRFKPDVAMVLGWQDASLVQALLACKFMNVPVILRGESNDKRTRERWKSLLQKAYVARAESLLAIGDANASFYKSLGIPGDRIRLARYCVDNERFKRASELLRPDRACIRAQWGISETEFCVAFVGKLEPKKRVTDVVEAIALSRREGAAIRALVVGTGVQMGEAKALAETLKVPISFAGFLNQGEIARAYVAADALVLPSDYGETWGLVCNESMACGTPAIVTDRVGNAGDLVVDAVTGAVVPFADPHAISRVLVAWAADPSVPRELGRAAEERVATLFSLEAAVDGLHQAIEVALRD